MVAYSKRRIPVVDVIPEEYGKIQTLPLWRIWALFGQGVRRSGTTQSVDTTERASQNGRNFADVHNMNSFKGHSPIGEANASKPGTIIASEDRMYTVDSDAFFLIHGTEKHTKERKRPGNQTANGVVFSTIEARVYIQEEITFT